jgi:hypothetical protein
MPNVEYTILNMGSLYSPNYYVCMNYLDSLSPKKNEGLNSEQSLLIRD